MAADSDYISEFISFAHVLADAARCETLPIFRNAAVVSNKAKGSEYDPVTNADREAERVLRKLIQTHYPEHGILGEEFGEREGKSQWRWVLDPIDGTRAFVCGVASWATLIALECDGEPVLGLIDQPFTDERWVGVMRETRYKRSDNEGGCLTSGVTDLAKARLSTTDPRRAGFFNLDEERAFARVAERAQICRFSLDAYGYALLAMGELDLVIESGLQRHDYAALIPVIEGAGGVITNWRGEVAGTDTRGEILAAATSDLHREALGVLGAQG